MGNKNTHEKKYTNTFTCINTSTSLKTSSSVSPSPTRVTQTCDIFNPTGTFSYYDYNKTYNTYWKKCSDSLNDIINDAIINGKNEVEYSIKNVNYKIDIPSMTQYNLMTNKKRRIRNNEYSMPMYKNCYEIWVPFPNDVRSYVYEAFKFNEKKKIMINLIEYIIDPITKKEKNTQTGFEREICIM
ncbi:WWE domain-containing protein [Bodo saltans virus]|uniref:WWE domain-containing protein n=1 Tax=Bodo saltans virus TaxID=2024608 RepID=A0A2H4UVT8_9VIRU|nr:WWE domain-containing protein [Bodo saltans virus]ATZ80955.1 WWE domain-containing protein [Bodo saltans virus]